MTHNCSKQDVFALKANQAWSSAHTDAPDTLFHYCTADGALSIGRSRKIWSSAFEYMNDENEFRLGLNMAIEEIKKSIDFLNINHKATIKENWDRFLQDEIQNPKLRPYVLSFSSEPNIDYMWNSYADHNKGIVLKLSFDKKQISASHSYVLKMSYDIISKRLELNNYLRLLEADFNSKTCPSCLNDNLSNLFCAYLQTAFFCSITVKDKIWSKEKEWRLVSFANPCLNPQSYFGDIKYRTRRGHIIDYLEVDLFQIGLSIDALITGSDTSKNGIALFAKQHGYSID